MGIDKQIELNVNVPKGGLYRYAFFDLGYEHNQPVADRRTGWPAARGLPLPEGVVTDLSRLGLRDADGQAVPFQARPLAHWPDGSVMFAHVAWQADVAHDAPSSFTLVLDADEPSPRPKMPAVAAHDDGRVVLDNGVLRVEVDDVGRAPTIQLTRHGKLVCDGPLELWTKDSGGAKYGGRLFETDAMEIVETGPMSAMVEWRGRHEDGKGGVFLDFVLQIRLDAGRDELTMTHQFINMGDEPDGVAVGEIALRLPAVSPTPYKHVLIQPNAGPKSFARVSEFPEAVDLRIGSTGSHVADAAVLREDTTGYPSYLLLYLDMVDPWAVARTEDFSLQTFVMEGKENWPKTLRIDGGVIEYGIWPTGTELHNLMQGMARTHQIRLAFFDADAPAVDFHRYYYQVETPVNAVAPFEWYQHCKVFGMQYVMPWLPTEYPLIEGAMIGTAERGWSTGMLGYGDDPNSGYDYTNVGMADEIVWINNEHDFTAQAATQYWRSGRPGAWLSSRVCAQHQIDVDFVRKSADPWKEGGIPAHSHFHTSASVYPSHTWTEGLLQYYVTSGDRRALEVAKSLARNLCKYAEEHIAAYEIETRMAGWGLLALVAVIEITRDERCLAAAHAIRDTVGEVVDRTGTYDPEGYNYGTGVLLTAFGHLHRVTGDDVALDLMKRIMDWHLEHGRNDVGVVWGDQTEPYDLNLTLPAYSYLYHATGDTKYRDEGIAFFRYTGPPVSAGANVRSASKHYRTFMPFLLVAHEAGMLHEMEARKR